MLDADDPSEGLRCGQNDDPAQACAEIDEHMLLRLQFEHAHDLGEVGVIRRLIFARLAIVDAELRHRDDGLGAYAVEPFVEAPLRTPKHPARGPADAFIPDVFGHMAKYGVEIHLAALA